MKLLGLPLIPLSLLIFDHVLDESAEVLFESLRQLQLMPLSVEILKSTEIGKSVYALRKHVSKKIPFL
ncbi:Transcription elongation factor family protein [Perilla frutescens var. frutescens]|nr:Transcription elongation factor family protein [Perilla frutescens var. frutescens]